MDFDENSVVTEQEKAVPAETSEENSENPGVADQAEESNETKPSLTQDQMWKISRTRSEQEVKSKYDKMIAARFKGFKTPDGRPVETFEDYIATFDAEQAAARERAVSNVARSMPQEQAQQLVNLLKNDPERIRLQAENDTLRQVAMQAQGQKQFEEQMQEISKLDPSIKSLADITKIEEFNDFDAMVRSGRFSMVEAFKLACYKRLNQNHAAAAKQAAINEAKGKAHLSPVGGGQAVDDGLTDEIIQNYRKYNPKWTREQIAAFHRSYTKE